MPSPKPKTGNGRWSLRNPDDSSHDFWYGVSSDIPIMCDWDGDGLMDVIGLEPRTGPDALRLLRQAPLGNWTRRCAD